jgi:hypothetical protein
LSACKKDKNEEPENQVITPGVGITGLNIGDPAQKAIDLYGTVAPSYGEFGGSYTHFLTYFSKGVIVYMELTTESEFNNQMPVKSILLSSPYTGKTPEQIGIGSTKAEVKAAYGEPINSSMYFGDEYAVGITFIYDEPGEKVEQIEVEKF